MEHLSRNLSKFVWRAIGFRNQHQIIMFDSNVIFFYSPDHRVSVQKNSGPALHLTSLCAGAGSLPAETGSGSSLRDSVNTGGEARRHGGGAKEPGLTAGGEGEIIQTGEHHDTDQEGRWS